VQASYHAGQVCVSTQRIYVHADLEHEFLERFTARVAALKVGDPVLADIEVGTLITPHERSARACPNEFGLTSASESCVDRGRE
jgi:acyl-CoA reductase-like NAD-dependent aldehyde dehydrogenase